MKFEFTEKVTCKIIAEYTDYGIVDWISIENIIPDEAGKEEEALIDKAWEKYKTLR